MNMTPLAEPGRWRTKTSPPVIGQCLSRCAMASAHVDVLGLRTFARSKNQPFLVHRPANNAGASVAYEVVSIPRYRE
jgi:hypothetical protein